MFSPLVFYRNQSAQRQQLLASIFLNFLSKVPGIAAVFIILPLISRALGSELYGNLLSALALGATLSLPFGGGNAIGRRLLATAAARKDQVNQANIFITTTAYSGIIFFLSCLGTFYLTWGKWENNIFCLIAILPIIAAFLNTYDNLRSSYNEHYVTATFQLFFQIFIYSAAIILTLPEGSILLSGLVIQSPYALASLGTLLVLIYQRPYLVRIGHVKDLKKMLLPSIGIILADGSLLALLNLSVYWIDQTGASGYAAWIGTFVRLFQSLLSPLLLILFPLTSYISIQWEGLHAEKRSFLHTTFLLLGVAYGSLVGVLLFFFGPYYINSMFSLDVRGDFLDVLALSVFMGAIIMQKAYTFLLYSVSDARFASFGTAAVSLIGILLAWLSIGTLSAPQVLNVLFFSVGIGLPLLLLIEQSRQRKKYKTASSPQSTPNA